MKKLFNDEQCKFIVENYETMKYKDIANKLGDYTPTQIAGWLSNNGYKKSNRSIFSEKDKLYIANNYLDKRYAEIANDLNFSERQIRHYVEHYLRNKNRMFDKRYFQNIDTPLKAYWLGYIYADGYIIANEKSSTYEFGMELQLKDIDVLIDLNNYLGGVHKISTAHHERVICNNKNISITDSAILRVYSRDIVYDLMSHNILLNKTYQRQFPIVENYFLDFLRGYIDGDGCIYINKAKNDYVFVHITCYHDDVLKYISERIYNEYSIKSVVTCENPKKHRIYFYGNNARQLLDLIYYDKNVQKLDRKYQKYLLLK